ncbi:MAG TPA: immunoglobulin-like domain-containing protein [Actinomycetota bacterium]|nr:immunoglobulin-like domain-containing protein [Actinomycetota bacterium]
MLPYAGALLVVALTGAGCVQQADGSAAPDPRLRATVLYDQHERAEEAFSSPDAPDECPTRFVEYGSNEPTGDVIDYFKDQGLDEIDVVDNQYGHHPQWSGERSENGLPTSQIDVWTGRNDGHLEWTTVFTVATAQCDLVASAEYSVTPRVVPYGDVPNAILTDDGDLGIEYGLAFQIQRRVSGHWRNAPLGRVHGVRCAFPGIAKQLVSGGVDKQSISLCEESRPLEPGRYRVLKDVSFEAYGDATLRAKFRIGPRHDS